MPNFKSVVIVTYGRSGSTLLQGLLNKMPGFLVRGENQGFAGGLLNAWNRINSATEGRDSEELDQPTHPWFGVSDLDLDLFMENLRRLMRDALVPPGQQSEVACFGFKEVRYPVQPERFMEYMKFLRQIMPDLAIIINTRSQEDVARSAWWARKPKADVLRLLTKHETNFTKYLRKNPDHTFHIQYEEVCAKAPKLRQLYEFLGVPYDEAAIEATLAVKHSNITRGRVEKQAARRAAQGDDSETDESDDRAARRKARRKKRKKLA